MTLRRKLIVYLAGIHLVFAVAAVWFLRNDRPWLLAVEVVFFISLLAARKVVASIFGPLDLIRTGVQSLRDSDFSARFRKVGQPEMDELTAVYNKMVDHLREERIRVQEHRHFLDEIIRASPSAILVFDFEERISSANPAAEAMLGASAEALAGRTLLELGTPFARQVAAVAVDESKVVPLEGIRRVRCRKSRFLDRGFPRSFLMLEELTEELRRAERAAYEKIIRLMSHEVNNSVGAGTSLLESCLTYRSQLRDDDRSDFETALRVAIERSRHLNAFVKSYADVIRLPQPDRRPCDLRALLEDIALLLRSECRARSIAWNWDFAEPIEPIDLDKNQMEQVFVNVLKNAIEAIGEHGSITVRMGKKLGHPFVVIEDTGCGFTPEVRTDLFTPFFSTKQNGQGIGLTLVQEILTRHRFHFSLDGEPGAPTQFSIYF